MSSEPAAHLFRVGDRVTRRGGSGVEGEVLADSGSMGGLNPVLGWEPGTPRPPAATTGLIPVFWMDRDRGVHEWWEDPAGLEVAPAN
ncbi:hypothetical protein ACNQR9_34600 [Mycolicibacterium peregrinum]|uniref:Uncharacterized protein n=2 Tax=Mycobacteriaceae TaxID=1762 RepID=A0ABS4ZQV6_9MYCO|nr:hypothetical protein [Mycolicibacterium lutetiense]MBP2451879.1 hypothetical protein [Mycolicibacterium lutetiense]